MAERRAVGPGNRGGSQPEHGRPFVGRVQELDQLLSALEVTFSDRGSLLLVSGEAGIGKSRLMEVAAQRAAVMGWRVLQGRCWEGGGAPAFWPWTEVVHAAGSEFDALAPIPDAWSRSVHAQAVARESRDPDAARFRLFDAIGRFLSEVSGERPCLVALDDLHAADTPSLLLLRFMATRIAELRIVIVASYREPDPALREQAEVFADLVRLATRIVLRGLSRVEVATYIELASGRAPSDALIGRVHELTGGNPFFLGEVVGVLGADERLAGIAETDETSLDLPEEVRALIRRRLSGVSREAVTTLRVAAVLGREIDLRVLSPTLTLSGARVADVFAEAVRAGIVAVDRSAPGTYRFSHDLVRQTLYEDLAPARQMEIHRAVARVLEQVHAADIGPRLTEIAHHFAHAAPLGDVEAELAISYLMKAGEQAMVVLAYEDAARLYARALNLSTGPPSGEILLRLGDAESRCGRTDAARRAYEEAAGVARRTGDTATLARAALGHVATAVPARFGMGGLVLAQVFDAASSGLALLEEAERALPFEDSALRVQVLSRLATELCISNQTERCLTLSRDAVDMARRLGDPAALVEALHGRLWVLLGPDLLSERLASADEMLAVATAARDEEAAFLARQARLHYFLESCDVAGFDAELCAMELLAGRIRQPYYLWHVEFLHATRALLDGRLDEAERRAGRTARMAHLAGSEFVAYAYELTQVATIRWSQGRMDEVADRIRLHGDRYPGIARWRNALAAVEVGDERGAREEIERHGRHDFADLPRDGLWLLHLCALAEACVLVRDEPRGAALYALLAPYADRNAISVTVMSFGPVALRLGMLAAMLQRWEQAAKDFDLAAARSDAIGAPAITARGYMEKAKMQLARRAAGDRARAVQLLTDAKRIAEAHDLPGILQRVDALFALARPGPDSDVACQSARFIREGDYWTVEFIDELARLRHRKGLAYVAALLAVPGREVHVLDLVGPAPVPGRAAAPELEQTRLDSADAVLDPQAKAAYRRRLGQLREDLDEARTWHDSERTVRIEEEIDVVTRELVSALGLGGRDRRFPSPAERARVNVTKAIKTAIMAIETPCPRLGQHLTESVHTGRFCSYAPPGQAPPVWEL